MNILLVDDHEVVRRGLRQMLADEFGTDGQTVLFGEAASAADAIDRLREVRWDLVILDIRMPGRSGIDVLADMRHRQPDLRVLMLSMAADGELAQRAMREGACGYLSKETVAHEFIEAVRQILAGGRYLSPAVAERITASLVTHGPSQHDKLSERERQVLCMVAAGRTIKEIAAELAVSDKTVFTYRERLRDKLRLRNDADITRYALRHGLIE